MHLAQSIFALLEELAREGGLAKVSGVHLKILQADTGCLVESLKMLFGASPVFRGARVETVEADGDEADDPDTRVVIERIEGEKDY
jgi:hypothetical protein